MPNIEIKFDKYIPSGQIVYEYYTILKALHFIDEPKPMKEMKTIKIEPLTTPYS